MINGNEFTPELNLVKVESPTEDGKLAYVMNTMVPRRLDQFDDIKTDLANVNFNIDKAFLYVNFQAGDFCGRSYKIPLSEVASFVRDSLFFGVNGRDPLISYDKNFRVDKDGSIHLIVDSEGNLLYDKLLQLVAKDEYLEAAITSEGIERKAEDEILELKKQDKFVILGSGDVLNSEGLPEPALGVDGYGVHVTYDPKDNDGKPLYDGPIIDAEGNRGSAILIDHTAVVPAGGWISKYAVGGIAIGQAFPEGTKITEVWRQLLEGDPKADNVICGAVTSTLPTYWTDIAWRQFTVKRNELWVLDDPATLDGHSVPFNKWTPIVANQQYIVLSIPLSMIHEEGTDLVYEKRVRLKEVYNTSTPAFTYTFGKYDIKNNPAAEEVGYRVYYLTNKVTGTFDDLVWEFTYNNPDGPDYE